MPIVGWRRVPSATACDFCLMLASRGAVYSTEESASFEAHAPDALGRGGVCSCTVEPVYERAKDPPEIVALREEFERVTGSIASKAAKLAAWRKYLRNRDTKPALSAADAKGAADALTRALEVGDMSERARRHTAASIRRGLSPAQAQALAPVLEALEAGTDLRGALGAAARQAGLRQIGEPGQLLRLPGDQVEWIGAGRGPIVQVVRPGWEATVGGKPVVIQRAAVQAATPEQAAAFGQRVTVPPSSVPALAREVAAAGVDLPLTGVPDGVLSKALERLRSGSTPEVERARLRQAIIDPRRALADALAEAAERVDDGADVLSVVARARTRRSESTVAGWAEQEQLQALSAAMQTGDPQAIRQAIAAAERSLELRPVGTVDAATAFDRELMRPLGGSIRDGERVKVVRPGYTATIAGDRVVLAKAVVTT